MSAKSFLVETVGSGKVGEGEGEGDEEMSSSESFDESVFEPAPSLDVLLARSEANLATAKRTIASLIEQMTSYKEIFQGKL